jgi:iron complex outermembrane receptor protein
MLHYRTYSHLLSSTTLGLVAFLPVLMGAAPQETRMDPLVVTADRPAGSVLSEGDLDLFQAGSVAGLSGLVPGFGVVTSDTRGYGDILSMRGSANTLFFSPPAVGMVVDDVPMGDTCSYADGLLEWDQVKILRGPQGTLYGRNGAAGMLDMSTPRPGAASETRLSTEYGSYDSWAARLRSGGPLGEGFSQTFQFYHQQRDGYIYNPTLGRATDDRSVTGGLANLYWKPTPDSEWRLRVMVERADDGGPRLSSLDSNDPFRVESEIPGKTVTERHQISLHYTKEGAWGRFKSITAWQDWKLDPSITDLDLRNSYPGYESSSMIQQDQRLWSQEFRWESPEEAGPWSWRTGVFFMNQESSGDSIRAYPKPPYYFQTSERTIYQLDQWNAAAYGRASYAVNPRLNLLAGVRLEYVDSEIDQNKTIDSNPNPPVREDEGDCYVSPEIGASYALSDTTRLFARSALGVKPAGFSGFVGDAALAAYQDEVALTHELGVELAWPDAHLTGSLTGFWNRIDDYQLNRSAAWPSTDYYTVNAGRVTSWGLETQLRWKATDELIVQGSAGYVNASFEDAPNDGEHVPFVPEFTACLGARYDLPKGFYVQSAVRMTGVTYFNEANEAKYRQGAYLCWDAEIGYAVDHFSVAFYGRNLLDREYYSYINSSIDAGSPGDPQVFGIRATLLF